MSINAFIKSSPRMVYFSVKQKKKNISVVACSPGAATPTASGR